MRILDKEYFPPDSKENDDNENKYLLDRFDVEEVLTNNKINFHTQLQPDDEKIEDRIKKLQFPVMKNSVVFTQNMLLQNKQNKNQFMYLIFPWNKIFSLRQFMKMTDLPENSLQQTDPETLRELTKSS